MGMELVRWLVLLFQLVLKIEVVMPVPVKMWV